LKNSKRRRPLLAVFLSFLTPGLGQIYNGQLRRGVMIYIIGLMLFSLLLNTLALKFNGLLACVIIYFFYKLFTISDAAINTTKIKKRKLKKYNKWLLYLFIILFHIGVVTPILLVYINPLKAYRVPSDSMAPTLNNGDIFFVDTRYYDFNIPKRGDIVVFQSPQNHQVNFVKRIIALPGERFRIEDRQIYINNEPIDDSYAYYSTTSINAGLEQYRSNVIPRDSVFAMGDNRDQSHDSRHYGVVKISALKGKALYIIVSKLKTGSSLY